MNKKEFLNLVSLFLQNPEEIEHDSDFVTFSNGENDYALTLMLKDEVLYCKENDDLPARPAMEWITYRLAHLDVLARAIKEYSARQIENYIVVPCTEVIDNESIRVEDAVAELSARLRNAKDFSTSVYYLTAEAGEGKSVIVYKVAHLMATEFLQHRQKWLFVPIELGGRPFMRLDEIVLGMLSKCYRYNSCYLESFMELVKRGYIVLGLDGFEEMAVPGAEGDVVSSLGVMLNDLDSQGQLVFSTRTAYYNYSQLKSRALFQGIPGVCDVDFYEFRLNKWTSNQFVDLMVAYGFDRDESASVQSRLAQALGEEHPILSRAVLVHSLVKELAKSREDGKSLTISDAIDCFRNTNGHEAVARFVELLISRETRKWVSRDQLATPILSAEEHMRLLMSVADEMWRSDSEVIRDDALMTVAELVCEEMGKSPAVTKQCKERIIDHAMLSIDQGRFKKFCHIDFMQFFLGYAFAQRIMLGVSMHLVSEDLDRKILPLVTLAECAREIKRQGQSACVLEWLANSVNGVSRVSCQSQNVASLLLLLHSGIETGIELKNVYCSRAALDTVDLKNVSFRNCCLEQFENASVSSGGVSFLDCDIPIFYLGRDSSLAGVKFDKKSLPSLLKRSEDGSVLDCTNPSVICGVLKNAGAEIEPTVEVVSEPIEDDLVCLFYKVVYLFNTRTYITTNLLKTKLGVNYSRFNDELRNCMVRNGILMETNSRDGSSTCVFKLARPFSELEELHRACCGSFSQLRQLIAHA